MRDFAGRAAMHSKVSTCNKWPGIALIERTPYCGKSEFQYIAADQNPSNGGVWAMRPTSNPGEAVGRSESEGRAHAADLPIAPGDLEKLARWVPKKEMALLIEICDRARRDPDLARPALLLCSAYGKRVARMLDQDPFPAVTRQIAARLQQLRERNGL